MLIYLAEKNALEKDIKKSPNYLKSTKNTYQSKCNVFRGHQYNGKPRLKLHDLASDFDALYA